MLQKYEHCLGITSEEKEQQSRAMPPEPLHRINLIGNQGAVSTSTDAAKFFICNSLCPKDNPTTDKETNDVCRQLNECDGPAPAAAATTTTSNGPSAATATATATATPPLASSSTPFNPFAGDDDYGDYVEA